MKGDYALLDMVRHELLKYGIKSNLSKKDEHWSLDCIHCHVLIDEVPHKFFICDNDYSAFYITGSLSAAVCEVERFIVSHWS